MSEHYVLVTEDLICSDRVPGLIPQEWRGREDLLIAAAIQRDDWHEEVSE